MAYFFMKLLINISNNLLSNINTIGKLFFILLDLFQNIDFIDAINLLANNALKYQIIFINSIIFSINLRSYSFTILTNLQYDNFKFKRILINSSIIIKSIQDIGQLKTLQKIVC